MKTRYFCAFFVSLFIIIHGSLFGVDSAPTHVQPPAIAVQTTTNKDRRDALLSEHSCKDMVAFLESFDNGDWTEETVTQLNADQRTLLQIALLQKGVKTTTQVTPLMANKVALTTIQKNLVNIKKTHLLTFFDKKLKKAKKRKKTPLPSTLIDALEKLPPEGLEILFQELEEIAIKENEGLFTRYYPTLLGALPLTWMGLGMALANNNTAVHELFLKQHKARPFSLSSDEDFYKKTIQSLEVSKRKDIRLFESDNEMYGMHASGKDTIVIEDKIMNLLSDTIIDDCLAEVLTKEREMNPSLGSTEKSFKENLKEWLKTQKLPPQPINPTSQETFNYQVLSKTVTLANTKIQKMKRFVLIHEAKHLEYNHVWLWRPLVLLSLFPCVHFGLKGYKWLSTKFINHTAQKNKYSKNHYLYYLKKLNALIADSSLTKFIVSFYLACKFMQHQEYEADTEAIKEGGKDAAEGCRIFCSAALKLHGDQENPLDIIHPSLKNRSENATAVERSLPT